jgi:hypothetical protein
VNVLINVKTVLIQPPVIILVTAVDAIRYHVARGRRYYGSLPQRRLYSSLQSQRNATMAQTINRAESTCVWPMARSCPTLGILVLCCKRGQLAA